MTPCSAGGNDGIGAKLLFEVKCFSLILILSKSECCMRKLRIKSRVSLETNKESLQDCFVMFIQEPTAKVAAPMACILMFSILEILLRQ